MVRLNTDGEEKGFQEAFWEYSSSTAPSHVPSKGILVGRRLRPSSAQIHGRTQEMEK